MGQLYDKEKDEDGFLYVAYSGENTFGDKAFFKQQGWCFTDHTHTDTH